MIIHLGLEKTLGKAFCITHMSIALVNYISCWRCNYPHIGQTVREEFWCVHNGLAVFEVHTIILYLRCGTVQRENCRVREVRLEE